MTTYLYGNRDGNKNNGNACSDHKGYNVLLPKYNGIYVANRYGNQKDCIK